MPNRSRENSLWAWLRDGAGPNTMMERIENSVSRGTPDVFGIDSTSVFVVELKVYPKVLEPKQASFLRRWSAAGGRAWVLYKKGNDIYLVNSRNCLHLLTSPLDQDLEAISDFMNMNPRQFITVMAHGYEE